MIPDYALLGFVFVPWCVLVLESPTHWQANIQGERRARGVLAPTTLVPHVACRQSTPLGVSHVCMRRPLPCTRLGARFAACIFPARASDSIGECLIVTRIREEECFHNCRNPSWIGVPCMQSVFLHAQVGRGIISVEKTKCVHVACSDRVPSPKWLCRPLLMVAVTTATRCRAVGSNFKQDGSRRCQNIQSFDNFILFLFIFIFFSFLRKILDWSTQYCQIRFLRVWIRGNRYFNCQIQWKF